MLVKKIISSAILLATLHVNAQKPIDKIINVAEVERIEKVLAADDMMGRKTFGPHIDKAAEFIGNEFKTAGLSFFNGLNAYLQPFNMVKAKLVSARGRLGDTILATDDMVAITQEPLLSVTEKTGYLQITLDSTANLFTTYFKLAGGKENTLIWLPKAQAKNLARLLRIAGREGFAGKPNLLFVIGTAEANTPFLFEFEHTISQAPLANVVGVLPGKSKANELVIFSGHYDHIGVGKPNAQGDSIYNGANDDAAGTAAVILLAKYFAAQKNNERTLVFVTFTAEEVGGFGSQYFSKQIDADKAVAMFNIEMIGTESKWGKNSAYITGFDKSDFGKILQDNLQGSAFKFEPDPYPQQNLFYRSDNATLAELGVPAHTISTSKMDVEKFYHTQDDEIETLDMQNMTEIIKAIAISSTSIVAGKQTPSRVALPKK